MNKRYFVLSTTEGCATNLLENSSYRKQYENQGFEASTSAESADVILINTCAYSTDMENKAVDIISNLKSKYPGKEIVLAGCLPKINPKKIRTDFSDMKVQSLPVDQSHSQTHQFNSEDFEGLSSKHQLVLKLRPYYYKLEKLIGFKLSPLHNIFKSVIVNEDFFLITVSTGCLGKCTFCAIKRAKGSLKSRPLATLKSEFEAGLALGKKKFWLLGDDIGCYGQDLGLSLVDLLKVFTQSDAQFELVVNYLDPHYLVKYVDELKDVFKDQRIIGVNMPIQSGSDKILVDMARRYEASAVYQALSQLKSKNSGLAVKTNIIVGFPGESWNDFFKSIYSVFKFDAILALKFTPRPQTPAAAYKNQIPELVKQIRMQMMNGTILLRHVYVAFSSLFRLKKV